MKNYVVDNLKIIHEEENKLTPISEITYSEALKRFLKVAGPFSLTRLMSAGSDFAGSIMLSKININNLAASGLITVVNNFIMIGCGAALYATGTVEGSLLSEEKDKKEIGKVLNASCVFALMLGAGGSAVFIFAKPILSALGQDKTVATIVGDYFWHYVVTGGPIANLLSVSHQQTAFAINKAHVPLYINIFRRALYVGLAYWLIYGGLGVPALGAGGLAVASSISNWFDLAAFALYFKFSQTLQNFEFYTCDSFKSLFYFIPLLKKSVLYGIQTLNEFLIGIVNANFIGAIGINELAALEISNQYNALVNIPILSASQSAGIEVSKYAKIHGLNAQKLGRVALVCSLIIPLVVIPVFALAGEELAKPFLGQVQNNSNEQQLIKLSKTLLLITGLNQLPNTIRNLCGGILRGHDMYSVAMITNIVSLSLIGLPIGIALGYLTNLSSVGFYLSTSIGSSFAATAMFSFWKRKDTQATRVNFVGSGISKIKGSEIFDEPIETSNRNQKSYGSFYSINSRDDLKDIYSEAESKYGNSKTIIIEPENLDSKEQQSKKFSSSCPCMIL